MLEGVSPVFAFLDPAFSDFLLSPYSYDPSRSDCLLRSLRSRVVTDLMKIQVTDPQLVDFLHHASCKVACNSSPLRRLLGLPLRAQSLIFST